MEELQKYDINDIENCINIFYKKNVDSKHPVEHPTAYILGGQSGAGKTTLHRMLKNQNDNIIVINADEFRELHPHFTELNEKYSNKSVNYTQPFINAVTNTLIDKLSNERYNLIIEGTCRRPEVPLKTCNDLKEKGYQTELMIICTNKDVAWQSTIDRYNLMLEQGKVPRAVPRDKFDDTVSNLADNVQSLYDSRRFDAVTLWNRNGDCLSDCIYKRKTSHHDIVDNVLYAFHQPYITDDYAYSFYVQIEGDGYTDKLTAEKTIELFKHIYDSESEIFVGVDAYKLDGSSYINNSSEVSANIAYAIEGDVEIEYIDNKLKNFKGLSQCKEIKLIREQLEDFIEERENTLDLTQNNDKSR